MCKKILKIAVALSLFIVGNAFAQSNLYSDVPEGAEAVSLTDGRALTMPDASNETVLKNLADARYKYMDYPMNSDNAVWYGRRLAYAGDFREAIKIFSEGMLDNPNDPSIFTSSWTSLCHNS